MVNKLGYFLQHEKNILPKQLKPLAEMTTSSVVSVMCSHTAALQGTHVLVLHLHLLLTPVYMRMHSPMALEYHGCWLARNLVTKLPGTILTLVPF